MSEFNARMAIADDGLYHEHGDKFELCPGGDHESIIVSYAIISDEKVEERETQSGGQIVYTVFARFSTNPASPKFSGIEEPKRMGVMKIKGVEYQVHSISRNDSGSCEIEGRRYGRLAVQRSGHDGGKY